MGYEDQEGGTERIELGSGSRPGCQPTNDGASEGQEPDEHAEHLGVGAQMNHPETTQASSDLRMFWSLGFGCMGWYVGICLLGALLVGSVILAMELRSPWAGLLALGLSAAVAIAVHRRRKGQR